MATDAEVLVRSLPYRMLIDGGLVDSNVRIDVFDPAIGAAFAQAPDASRDQLELAVAAASRAFKRWRLVPARTRQAALSEVARRLESHAESLAQLLTREQGRPLAGTRLELADCVHWCRVFSTLDLGDDAERRTDSHGRPYDVLRVPLGVVAAIAPWNYPLLLAIWKIAPALIAGNTVVLKPSPHTPLTTLEFAALVADALPPGVLNVISGGERLGPWLSQHRDVAKIAFTGSTATGRRVMQGAAPTLKRLTLELGGNDPAIVLADVDVPKVARKLFTGAFFNSGQICVAAKRVYVHESIYDEFAAIFVQLARDVKMGPGTAPGVTMGPVQNRIQYESVKDLIAATVAAGHRVLVGGVLPSGPGWFIPPTVVDDPPDDARVVVEEPFGPVVPLLRWREIDEVIERANASDYALAASVWSADIDAAKAIARRLDAGTVWINSVLKLDPMVPLGGRKQSGFGVENALEGLHEFSDIQTIIS